MFPLLYNGCGRPKHCIDVQQSTGNRAEMEAMTVLVGEDLVGSQLANVKAHRSSELSSVLRPGKGWIRIEHTGREGGGSGGARVGKGGVGLEGVGRPMESGSGRGGGERGVGGRCGAGVECRRRWKAAGVGGTSGRGGRGSGVADGAAQRRGRWWQGPAARGSVAGGWRRAGGGDGR